MSTKADVVVIGAGPYGLAAAAQLRRAGREVHVLGEPMSFWERHMPRGMLLRSPWGGSSIGDMRAGPTLDDFERTRPAGIARPIPLAEFVAYGRWFRERTVPQVDARHVETVDPAPSGYRLRLVDGETMECVTLVVAAGIAAFASRPREFDGLPAELASHSSEHTDLARFAGRHVVVVGGGQSALESAALLKEHGADVEVIMRAPRLRWVGRATRAGWLGHLLFHRTDVGPAGLSQLVARPALLRRLPRALMDRAHRRSLVAGAALWLRPRVRDLPVSAGRRVVEATRANGHLRLRLDDGATRDVDHVLLATGYRVDVARYSFLSPATLAAVRRIDGYPVLDGGMQSTAPGLHFLGAPAAYSFGPLVRFVAGTEFAARALARSIAGRPRATAEPALEVGRAERAG